MKRPARWQARRIETAKALRALPKCETSDCDGRAFGLIRHHETQRDMALCVSCAVKLKAAQREKAP